MKKVRVSFYRRKTHLLMLVSAAQEKADDDDEDEDVASRFVARLLKHLIKGFLAKDKNVRYRVLQMVSELISHLGEIEYVISHSVSHTFFIIIKKKNQ